MATRKKTGAVPDENQPSLSEVLSDSSDSERVTWSDTNSLSILRLIHCVSCLGGMVTFWVDSNNSRICFSMRLWNQQRSYNIDHASQVPSVTEPIVGKLSKYLLERKLPAPPALPPLELVAKPKK